jgi:NAD(P)-dependent dehydrogenase (short-subunit alcohol dehydrogenase family)
MGTDRGKSGGRGGIVMGGKRVQGADWHVVVSGGTSGISLATATALASGGASVSLLALAAEASGPLVERAGGRVRFVPCDVRDEAGVEAAVDEAVAWAGAPAGAVAAAGIGVTGSVEDTPDADARDVMETNYLGVVRLVRAVLPRFDRERPARLVVVGSLAGRAAIPFQAHYSASKAAVDRFALALSMEVRHFGVRVALVEPGETRTRFNDVTRWLPVSPRYREAAAQVERAIRRAGDEAPGPEAVAATIVRALTARRPRHRYTVGPQTCQVRLGVRALPDALQVPLLERNFGLSARPNVPVLHRGRAPFPVVSGRP